MFGLKRGKVTEVFWDPVAAFGFVQGNLCQGRIFGTYPPGLAHEIPFFAGFVQENALLRRVSGTNPMTNNRPISFSKSVIVDTAHFSKSVFS